MANQMRSLDDLAGRIKRKETVRFPSGRMVSTLEDLRTAYPEEEARLKELAKNRAAAGSPTGTGAKGAKADAAKAPAPEPTEDQKKADAEAERLAKEEADKADAEARLEDRRKELAAMKVDELTPIADALKVEGAGTLLKADLVEAIIVAETKGEGE
jgi:hypothetical protein